jgi:hypothetical protein
VKDVPSTYNFTAKNTQDTNLESLSMLKTITDAPLRAGIHQNRWIGIKLTGYLDNALDLISTLPCFRSRKNTTTFCFSILGLSRDGGARGARDGV